MKSLLMFSALIGTVHLLDPQSAHQYIGPETIMPLASILAAIAGFFLLFWRIIVKIIKKIHRKIRGIPDEIPPEIKDEDPFGKKQE